MVTFAPAKETRHRKFGKKVHGHIVGTLRRSFPGGAQEKKGRDRPYGPGGTIRGVDLENNKNQR